MVSMLQKKLLDKFSLLIFSELDNLVAKEWF